MKHHEENPALLVTPAFTTDLSVAFYCCHARSIDEDLHGADYHRALASLPTGGQDERPLRRGGRSS